MVFGWFFTEKLGVRFRIVFGWFFKALNKMLHRTCLKQIGYVFGGFWEACRRVSKPLFVHVRSEKGQGEAF